MGKTKQDAEDLFLEKWNDFGWPNSGIVRQYRFHPVRRWTFDFAFPSKRVAIEVDGRGRHQTVVGVRRDCEKSNEAALMGWCVLRIPTSDLRGKDRYGEPLVEKFIELVNCILTLRDDYDTYGMDQKVEGLPAMPPSQECKSPRPLQRKDPR